MISGNEWTRTVEMAITLYDLVGSPTPVDGDRRPTDVEIERQP